MSGVIRESISFFEVIALAAEYAEREGKVSEKKLKKALGVHLPTAAKAICALAVTGVVGRKEKKYYPFTGSTGVPAEVQAERSRHKEDYLPLVEEDKAFAPIGVEGYMMGTLLPAIKIGVLYGSLSVVFLERKMSVGYERAHEIYDIIAACGLLGEEDDLNPGRKKMKLGFADFDALYARIGEGA